MEEREPIHVEILQPALASYRVPAFKFLAANPNLEVGVSYAAMVTVPNESPEGFAATAMSRIDFRLFGRTLIWYPGEWQAAGNRENHVVIHEWNLNNLSLLPSLLRARIRGQGSVVWGDGRSKQDSRARLWLRRSVARLADSALFYDRWTCAEFVDDGYPVSKAFVAPNALDTTVADKWGTQHERNYDSDLVVHVSRLQRRRDLDTLLRAAAILRDLGRDVQLVIVGDGDEERARLRSLSSKLDLAKIVEFREGTYDSEALAGLMVSAAVACYPKAGGGGVLHAAAHATPVCVGDDLDSHGLEARSMIRLGGAATFRDGDPADLARKLIRFLNSPPASEQEGLNARRVLDEEHSLDAMVAGFAAAIAAAAAAQRARTGGWRQLLRLAQ